MNMRLDSLIKWLTLAANVGVLAGIVFLAIEIQQNNEQLDSQARWTRAQNVSDVWQLVATDENVISAYVKSQSNEELSSAEYFQLRSVAALTFTNGFAFYRDIVQERLDPEELILSQSYTFEVNPLYHEFWDFHKPRFPEDFVAWYEANVVSP